MSKVCKKCGVEKDEVEFYFRMDSGKYRTCCKECTNKQAAANRKITGTSKVCAKCKEDKPLTDYHKYKGGLQPICKSCRTTYAKSTYDKKRKPYLAQYYKIKKGEIPEESPKTTQQLKAEAELRKPIRLQVAREKRSLNALLRTADNLRRRVNKVFSKIKSGKPAHTEELLGAYYATVMRHIESLFTDGMSWDKVGPEIQIDHIRPCASFNLTDPEQQKQCFHYTNLQPLWASENCAKNSKYNGKRYYYGDVND